jgi:outer membrane murein-binding lipoprotein Lpp
MLDADGNEIVDDSGEEEVIDTTTEKPVMADTGIPQEVADVIRGVHNDLQDNDEEIIDDTDDGEVDDSVATDGDDVVDDEVDLSVLGYSAETIEKLKGINPEILKDIKGLISATDLDDEVSEEAVEEEAKLDTTENVQTTGLTEEQILEIEKDNPQMAAVVRALNSQVSQLSSSLNTVAEAEKSRDLKAAQNAHIANFRSANKKLDEISEDFPILGQYKKLPQRDNKPDMRNSAVKQRAGIWDYAVKLHEGGVAATFEDAMDDSIALYKAKNAKNLAMREVSKELRGKAKKFTNRPTSKKTKKKEPTPGTDAHKISVVRGAMKDAGVTK